MATIASPIDLFPSQLETTSLAHTLIEKYQISDELNQSAARILMVLIAQSNLSGNRMEADCVELKDIFFRYQSLIKDLQELANQG